MGSADDSFRVIRCPHCRDGIPASGVHFGLSSEHCPQCAVKLDVAVFPHLFKATSSVPSYRDAGAEDAACFYHPAKQANQVCDHCGRFLCPLCHVDWHGAALCPVCVGSAELERAKGGSSSGGRTRFDRVALALCVLPAFLLWPTLITAPATLFFVAWFWRRPCSFQKPSGLRVRAGFLVAAVLATLQIAVWAIIITMALRGEF